MPGSVGRSRTYLSLSHVGSNASKLDDRMMLNKKTFFEGFKRFRRVLKDQKNDRVSSGCRGHSADLVS